MTPATRRTWLRGLAAAALALALTAGTTPARAADVLVFAAASLKNALDAVNGAWAATSGNAATASYAASSALAKQIEEGAPADVFVSADLKWMDYLAERKLVVDATRRNLLGNRIVLVAPADSAIALKIEPGFTLADSLGADGKLAIANVEAAPAGRYGKVSLEALGVWPSVEGSVAQADNVRAALALVATGEAPLGIVYTTDAAVEPKVRVVDTFPEDTHPAIVYPVATVASSTNLAAVAYVEFLISPEAKKIFADAGFTILE